MLFEFVDFANARLAAELASFGLPSEKKARMAATCLGMMILLLVLFVYLPILVASPTDVVSLNYFVDALLFGGAALVCGRCPEETDCSGRTGRRVAPPGSVRSLFQPDSAPITAFDVAAGAVDVLLVAQRVDRIEAGRFDSGIHAEEQANAHGNSHGQNDGPQGNG